MANSSVLMKGIADIVALRVLDKHGECYGYQLLKLISQESADLFAFQEGTLYPLMYKLERDGYVTSDRKPAPNGKERRYYTITKEGKGHLKKKMKEYQGFVNGVRAVFDFVSV